MQVANPTLLNLPMYYRKFVRGTVAEFVEAALSDAPSKQISLLEELALVRASAVASITTFNDAQEAWINETDPKEKLKKITILEIASENMRHALSQVAGMAKANADMMRLATDTVSAHNLQFIIAQITQIAHKVFGDNQEMAEEFTLLMRDEVKLIEGRKGTSLRVGETVDQQVMEMDATIPWTNEVLPESQAMGREDIA